MQLSAINENMDKNTKLPFAAAFTYFLKNKPKKTLTQKKISEIIGRGQGYICELAQGKYDGSESTRRAIAAIYGMSYEEFLSFGQSLILAQNQQNPELKPVHSSVKTKWSSDKQDQPELNGNIRALSPHEKTIRRFKDQDRAEKINELLVEIEDWSPEDYDKVEEVIKALHLVASQKKTPNHNSN